MRDMSFGNGTAVSVALVLALAAVPAAAQAQAGETQATAPGEIVVTATKRAENLQAVPVSVSAIGGDALSKSRTTSVDALVSKVANLQLSGVVGDNTPIFSLRGVSMSDYSLNQASPVATYYDEVYKGNFALLGVAMYDLDRVEVLRGPQGTLYGKNTTGGAVNIIAKDAKLGETSGYANAGYGNYNRFDASAAVNVPLGNNLALRVAGTYSKADGWFKNTVAGVGDLNATSEYGLRATLHYEPNDRLKMVLRASTSFQNPNNYGIYAQDANGQRLGASSDYTIASDVTQKRRARTFSLSLNTSYQVSDKISLVSVSSYDYGSLDFLEDSDGIPAKYLEVEYGDKARQFAQDLRLVTNTGGAFDAILGLYYNHEKVFNTNVFNIGTDQDLTGDGRVNSADCAAGVASGFFTACAITNRFDQTKDSFAAYSDLKYKLSEALTLRGGLRYTHDTGSQNGMRSDALGVDGVAVANLIPLTNQHFTKDNVSGKIGLDYKLANGNLLYASISRGYRAPSFNAQAFFQPSEVNTAHAEQVTSYEIGSKNRLLGRRLTLNLAGFYYSYSNQQFINLDPATAAQTLLNIAKSRIFGGEAEINLRINSRITARAGLGVLSTEVLQGSVSGVDVAGKHLANAPGFTANFGPEITLLDGAHGKLTLSPSVAYQSRQYFEAFNRSYLQQNGYALVDGHLDYEAPGGRWSASVWVKNATNKFYYTSRIDLLSGFGYVYNHIGTPRTFGGSVGFKF